MSLWLASACRHGLKIKPLQGLKVLFYIWWLQFSSMKTKLSCTTRLRVNVIECVIWIYSQMLQNKFNVYFRLLLRGCLFYGPPGTGKTLVARALANECSQGDRKVSFFMRKGADCLSKWVGESERQLRLLFDQVSKLASKTQTYLTNCFRVMSTLFLFWD